MPLVTMKPIGQQNGDILTQFTDTTSAASVTYTFPTQQTKLVIENSGEKDIFVTVGSYTDQVIKADKKWQVDVPFTSFSIRSNVNSQEFIATAILKSVEDLASLTSRLAESAKQQNVISKRGTVLPIISLVVGSEDETLAPANVTVSADTVNYKVGGRGWKITAAGAVTNAYVMMSPIPPAASGALTIKPSQAACMWVYVEDSTKVTNIQLELQEDPLLWSRANTNAPAQTLVNGWNLLRWKLVEGLPAGWTGTKLTRVRIFLTTTDATSVTVGHVWLEAPEKAKLIFVLDRGYKTFVDYGGVAKCRALGIPITWALDITMLGRNVGDAFDVVTEAQIAQYASEGDSISFHGWDGTATTSMTDSQYRTDTIKAIKWLQARGYKGRIWRAANVQDAAPASAITATKDYLIGNAQSAPHSVLLDCWPPRNIYSIARWAIFGRTAADVTNQFGLLQKTHGLMVAYNHGVQAAYQYDATPTEYEQFFQAVGQGINDGWLEASTFEELWFRNGGRFSQIGGSSVAIYTDVSGNVVTKNVL